MVTLYQVCSSSPDSSKNMAIRGWGLFSLYSYMKHFKNLFCQKPLDRFQYGRIVPLVILFQDSVQAIMMHEKKNMAAGEQGYKIYTKILEQ